MHMRLKAVQELFGAQRKQINLMKIEYNRNIVVAVIHKGIFRWFISSREMWVLDYGKWAACYPDNDIDVSEVSEDRNGIEVLDFDSMDFFVENNRSSIHSKEKVEVMFSEALRTDYVEDVIEFLPSVYVNFDSLTLISNHYEPFSFELYVPDGWTSSYGKFFDKIPSDKIYWSKALQNPDHYKDYSDIL